MTPGGNSKDSGLFNTVAAMIAPCSVKACGNLRRPPRELVTIRDLLDATSGSLVAAKLEVAICDFIPLLWVVFLDSK